MPELDFALIGDYVRPEGGIAHVIGAGIDTVVPPEVPTGHNFGLLLRLTFSRQELERPHRIEVIFQDMDGTRLAHLNTVATPTPVEGIPAGWRQGLQAAFNLGIPLPDYGQYSFEVLVNDTHLKSIPLRVVPPADPGAAAEP
jgi:hypothetical protein